MHVRSGFGWWCRAHGEPAQPGRRGRGWLPPSERREAGGWELGGLAVVWGQMSWLEAEGPQTGSRQAVSVQAGRWPGPGGPLQVVLTCPEVAPRPERTGGEGAPSNSQGARYRQGIRAIQF